MMIGAEDRVGRRREAKVASIIDAAWKLAQDNGVAGLSLHALARQVEMRQPSPYQYVDSVSLPRDSRAALKKLLRTFVEFAVEDRARSELLFHRHIPAFTPSPVSYALAEEALARAVKAIREAGVTQQGDVDCLVAMVAGIVDAQMANEPGGTRWTRHLNRLVDLYLDDALARSIHR